jgi:hypothetical protein
VLSIWFLPREEHAVVKSSGVSLRQLLISQVNEEVQECVMRGGGEQQRGSKVDIIQGL